MSNWFLISVRLFVKNSHLTVVETLDPSWNCVITTPTVHGPAPRKGIKIAKSKVLKKISKLYAFIFCLSGTICSEILLC